MTGLLPIGEISRQTGVKVTTIRFYESEGLLSTPDRTAGGRRVYGERDVKRLRFIRHARDLGFEMADLRTLLDLADHPEWPCEEADLIARRHLEAVDAKIAQLSALKGELERMVETCRHGVMAECRVIETLADHAHCATDHARA
jgi:DNA-binding transcriptional MerR regulator